MEFLQIETFLTMQCNFCLGGTIENIAANVVHYSYLRLYRANFLMTISYSQRLHLY